MSTLVDVRGNPIVSNPRQSWGGRTPALIRTSLANQGMDQSASLGPGTPQQPRSGYSVRPRSTDYPVGINLSTSSRQQWGRTPFTVLQAIIDAYDIARICINHKIDEIRSMEPMFVPADGISGNVEDALDAARAVMAFPDRENDWNSWINILLENALRYDAAPTYRRRNYDGEIISFENLDGTTVFPYVDENGRRPSAPAPAYFQRIKGMTDVWFTAEDITYNRFRPQANSPYGLAPIESVLLTANTDLRFQWHFLQMFTDGSIPGGFIELPPDISSPDQVAEWQDYWDSVTVGDQTILHKLLAVPSGTKMSETRPKAFDKTFPEHLASRVAAAFGVVPQDLGIVSDVNRANGETQTDIQFRVNTLPWVRFVEGIVSRYLQVDLGLPVKMDLDTGRDKEDRVSDAQAWEIYVRTGAASPDEMRTEVLGLPIDNERPIPRGFLSPRLGFIPFSSVEAISGKIDPETAAPADDVPLEETSFDGTPGLVPDKLPGGAQFKRAPINPDEPNFPELERPVPGTDTVALPVAPLAKSEATAGVTSATGIHGVDLVEEDDELVKSELTTFRRFAKARKARGSWRDFQFTAVGHVEAHRLNDSGRAELRKAAGEIIAAGLAVVAEDTGRVLMLQRALDPEDPAGGTLEMPGGHVEDGETPLQAAVREWCEEVGAILPHFGSQSGQWDSGIYQGFVYRIDSESQVPVRGEGLVSNPDDPDGDLIEAILWVNPEDLVGNPMVRPELAADLDAVLAAIAPKPVVIDAAEDDAAFLAEPLVKSWRDTVTKTPQHLYDLPITDHYAPAVHAALRLILDSVPVARIAAAVTGMFSKSTTTDVAVTAGTVAAAEQVREQIAALPKLDTRTLEQVVRDIRTEGYLAGIHAGMVQVGPHAMTLSGSAGEAAVAIDWDNWAPGNSLAAVKTVDGGLAELLDNASITVQGIADTTLDAIGNSIASGLDSGLSVDEISRDLSDFIDDPLRAERIAHTETTRAVMGASQDVWKTNGVTTWDWLDSDGACTAICVPMVEANPHSMDDPPPPGHPLCRCSGTPNASSVVAENITPTESGSDE
jgi:8-oxo-dGTP pyrophosphatase MutT (NUDIX family)